MKFHNQKKAAETQMRVKEMEQDLKQLQEYNPFGKPGYGAPRVRHARFRTFYAS